MNRLILTLAMILTVAGGLNAQSFRASDGFAVIIFKYNHVVNVWGKHHANAPYAVATTGDLSRVFPSGPKLVYGDGRIPNGIYQADLRVVDGRIVMDIPLEVIPAIFPGGLATIEHYRITGPSLSKNAIPLAKEVYAALCDNAQAMLDAGFTKMPVVILPGDLEPEVADLLQKAENVRDGYTLSDIQASCRRWKPVEHFIIRTGYIPGINAPALVFADGEIILPADPISPAPGESVAEQSRR